MNGFKQIPNTAEYLCSEDSTVFEAVERMNSTKFLFQIILDEKTKVSGTLTDGDVRRFLLNQGNINNSVRECMNSSPLLFDLNTLMNSADTIDKNLNFYPVVDQGLRLQSIFIFEKQSDVSSAFILAGGLGKRLGELTKNTPKPLLEIESKAIIHHVYKMFPGIESVTFICKTLFSRFF